MSRQNSKTTVAIIGGGVTGSTTALVLSEAGYKVILIEKGDLGNGASSRSVAAFRQQFSTEVSVRGMRYARKWFEHFGARCGEPVYYPRGYLFAYRDPEKFQDACELNEAQQSWGLHDAGVLTPKQVKSQFPYMGEHLAGATWCPTDGFLRPEVIYREAATMAAMSGAVILKNTEVIASKKNGTAITHLITQHLSPGGYHNETIPVDMVINASGFWTPHNVAKVFGCSPLPITPEQVFIYLLEHGETNVSSWPFIAAESGAYCRPDLTSTKIVLGWVKKTRSVGMEFDDEEQDRVKPEFSYRNPDGYGHLMWSEVANWVPITANMGLAGMGQGVYDTTPDHNPIIDWDSNVPNLIHAVGFSGHGVMHAPFTASILKHFLDVGEKRWTMMVDGSPVDLGAFSIDRSFSCGEKKVL